MKTISSTQPAVSSREANSNFRIPTPYPLTPITSFSRPRGFLMLLMIVLGAVFFTVLAGLSGFVLAENRVEDAGRAKAEALTIAEAGIEYYRWHLAHFVSDVQNGTGHGGPYAVSITDPESGLSLGTASLSIQANTACGVTTSVDIMATGTPANELSISQSIWARYARPSVGTYSYIVNASVWAGPDRIINGPYHSNGGVRMDGTSNSPVTSSLSTWDCTASFGCSPEQSTAPGVLGSGTNQNLWTYPTPQVDFAGIAANFSSLKTTAQTSGRYFPRVSSGSSGVNANKGYDIVFNADGTYTAREVTGVVDNVAVPINAGESNHDYTVIASEGAPTTYTLPTNCGLIYVEDNVWLSGTVPQKVTVVAANVTTAGIAPNAILRGNLQYGATDGSDGLTVLAENDVLISGDSPQTMTADGIFVAQNGAFGRNLFTDASFSTCDTTYEPRTTLTILGTTVSNLRTGTKWMGISCNSGTTAGYQTRVDAFDRNLSEDPPPFTPSVSGTYQFVDWQQR